MPFATTADIAARLEVAALSPEKTASATLLLPTASAVISQAAGKPDESWVAGLGETDAALVKGLTIELVCRAMASPQSLSSAREALGDHSREEVYRREAALVLTPEEKALIRQAAGRPNSQSVRVPSLIHDVYVREVP